MNSSLWQPDVTVAAVCEHNGQFLLVKERAKSSGKIVFNQPAGHLENGESIIQAVVRETREETCRHFTPEAVLGFYRVVSDEGKTYLRVAFVGSISEPDNRLKLDSDIISTHWLNHTQLQKHTQLRSPLVLACVEDYLSGIRYPLEILREL